MRAQWAVRHIAVLLVVLAAATARAKPPAPSATPLRAAPLKVQIKPLPEGVRRVELAPYGPNGAPRYILYRIDGRTERVTPNEFALRLSAEAAERGVLYRLLNITSPIGFGWVVLGLLGQVLFTGRMLIQWLASERERRSVVPIAFWWMSLAGASMLLVYFLWRKDIVGVLGQSAGWVVYVRNLWLIYRHPEDAAPKPA